ncbi:MAG: hypothetical protein AAF618_03795 [Pseudomonadota bacterium]
MKDIEVQATAFARQFPKMKEDVREHGVITVKSHNRRVGAFISPAVQDELAELRRQKRKLERAEDLRDGDFDQFEAALASYDDP